MKNICITAALAVLAAGTASAEISDGRVKIGIMNDQSGPYSALAGKPDWTAAKLASRCGMGACQGRVCGAAAKQLFGWQPPTPRPPYSPARVETLLQLAED